MMRLQILALLIFVTAGGVSAQDAKSLRMIALGDMPYGPPEEVYPPYETLIEEINARTPELVIHVGDTKSGRDDCTDQLLLEQLSYLQSFEAPVLYTPGDNECVERHDWCSQSPHFDAFLDFPRLS